MAFFKMIIDQDFYDNDDNIKKKKPVSVCALFNFSKINFKFENIMY